DAGATLGRVLFYDTRLSSDDRVSCASCHRQEFGFADTARFSKGGSGAFTRRHTMALANVRYYQNARFFPDERAPTLEKQVLHATWPFRSAQWKRSCGPRHTTRRSSPPRSARGRSRASESRWRSLNSSARSCPPTLASTLSTAAAARPISASSRRRNAKAESC